MAVTLAFLAGVVAGVFLMAILAAASRDDDRAGRG